MKNLTYNRSHYRRLSSKSGLPILEVMKKNSRVCIGSRIDPRREAVRIAKSTLEGGEQLARLAPVGSCNGYWHGGAGMENRAFVATRGRT